MDHCQIVPGLMLIFFKFLSHDFGGHSAHAGGATYYASLGLSASIIQAIGRWSSTAWEIYICENPTVRAEQQLVERTSGPYLILSYHRLD